VGNSDGGFLAESRYAEDGLVASTSREVLSADFADDADEEKIFAICVICGCLIPFSALRNSQFEIVMAVFRFSFWDGRLRQLAFGFLTTDGHRWTRIFQARRAGIFEDCDFKTNQAPFRSDISGICRPDGAEILFWFLVLQICRADGAGDVA
jgi:hypothetical protein